MLPNAQHIVIWQSNILKHGPPFWSCFMLKPYLECNMKDGTQTAPFPPYLNCRVLLPVCFFSSSVFFWIWCSCAWLCPHSHIIYSQIHLQGLMNERLRVPSSNVAVGLISTEHNCGDITALVVLSLAPYLKVCTDLGLEKLSAGACDLVLISGLLQFSVQTFNKCTFFILLKWVHFLDFCKRWNMFFLRCDTQLVGT